MVENNKILTVSYGTFSCTLEGFGDSFGAMKAIAEYFRDLAADDRYFGAEPPTPDAAMLARIAEKEISRRVEVREEARGITLRAEPMLQVPAEAPSLVTFGQAMLPHGSAYGAVEDAQPADAIASPETEADQTALVSVDTPAGDMACDDMEPAAADHRDDAGVTDQDGTSVMDAQAGEAAENCDTGWTHAADTVEAAVTSDAQDEAFDAVAACPVDEEVAPEVPVAAVLKAERDTDEGAAEQPGRTGPETDQTLAEKLARIRAVVAKAPEMDTFEFSADKSPTPSEQHGPDQPDAMAAFATEADRPGDGDTADADAAAAQDDVAGGAAAPEAPAPIVRVKKQKKKQKKKARKNAVAEDDLSPNTLVLDAGARVDTVVPQDGLDDGEASGIREALSLEEEIDLHQALADGDAEASSDEEQLDADFVDTETHKARLQDEAAKDAEPCASTPIATPVSGDSHDEDLTRLMASADARMAEPEGRGRRNAIAHLRAAVAATRKHASGDVSGKENAAIPSEMQTTPGETSEHETEASDKVAFKLVAEQRVDLVRDDEKRKPAGGIRPRRVSARKPDAEGSENAGSPVETGPKTSGQDFATYADAVGAKDLNGLMQAAAAYLTWVENKPHFSRPQLMTKVREAEMDSTAREDRLRVFGKLLREGKVEKVAAGQFQASKTIDFRPQQRAAG